MLMQRKSTKTPPGLDRIQGFLADYKRSVRGWIGASVLLTFCNAMLMIGGAWVLAGIIASILFDRVDPPVLYPSLYSLAAIYAVRAALSFGADRAAFTAAMAVKANVRRDLAQSLLRQPATGRSGEHSGAILNAYVEGVDALQGYYMQSLPARMIAVLVPVAVFLCIVPHDWVSGLVLLVTAPLIPVFMVWIGRGAERLSQRQWRSMTYMGGRFFDLVQGLPTLKLFNAARREGEAIRVLGEQFRRDTMAVLRLAFLSSLAMEFFATVSIALIAVLIGFRLLWGDMDFAHGFFILLLAPEFYSPLRRMGATYHAKMEAIGAAEKIMDVINAAGPERPDGAALTVSHATIEFRDVSFSHADGAPVLDRVNFTLYPGDRVALVGESGQGKSTIIRLILGFLAPQSGDILVNGHALSGLDMDSWRRHIGWVGQDARLFQGSVLDNIRIADDSLSDDGIRAMLGQCGVGDLADRMLGENGTGVSGGQAQRIILARALARRSPVFLLDEPAAYLDADSEELARQVMQAAPRNATVLFSTHRTETLSLASRIFCVDRGGVTEMMRAVA